MKQPESSSEGAVQFYVSFRITAADMANWTPERISRFFAGIAQVERAANEGEPKPDGAAIAVEVPQQPNAQPEQP
jgi:hypothetical protein